MRVKLSSGREQASRVVGATHKPGVGGGRAQSACPFGAYGAELGGPLEGGGGLGVAAAALGAERGLLERLGRGLVRVGGGGG